MTSNDNDLNNFPENQLTRENQKSLLPVAYTHRRALQSSLNGALQISAVPHV